MTTYIQAVAALPVAVGSRSFGVLAIAFEKFIVAQVREAKPLNRSRAALI